MKFGRYEVVVQIVGTLGVIASLLFVGFEIKQSRDIAMADIYQQRTGQGLDITLSRYSAEQYRSAMNKARYHLDTMTNEDRDVLTDSTYARFSFYENIHFQYQLGLISDEEWQATIVSISEDISVPCFDFWNQNERTYWRKSFANEIDNIKTQLIIAECEADTPDSNKQAP